MNTARITPALLLLAAAPAAAQVAIQTRPVATISLAHTEQGRVPPIAAPISTAPIATTPILTINRAPAPALSLLHSEPAPMTIAPSAFPAAERRLIMTSPASPQSLPAVPAPSSLLILAAAAVIHRRRR